MNRRVPLNTGHSIFNRLLNLARERKEDFNLLLQRYGIERLLYRISISPHAKRFILKGANLFLVWDGYSHRVTRDADLLGFGSSDPILMKTIFMETVQLSSVEEDGIVFDLDTVKAAEIREDQEYTGVRVTLSGRLYQARIPLQVDIGFGDAVTPAPEQVDFPCLLGGPQPRLLSYPKETMVSEKFEAMIRLGMVNSRMKDIYDVWLLSQRFVFDGSTLTQAIRNTFRRRGTAFPEGVPVVFSKEFCTDLQKQAQWNAFIKKSNPKEGPEEMGRTIEEVATFLMPIVSSIRDGRRFDTLWPRGGPWQRTSSIRISI